MILCIIYKYTHLYLKLGNIKGKTPFNVLVLPRQKLPKVWEGSKEGVDCRKLGVNYL